ncbi:hypothetical protein Tco_0864733, partial [Tanacetum coccineum]
LVPSCCVIFDLEPLSLSFDFIFKSEIFKPFSLRSLPSYDLVSWYQHAYHLESLIAISLENLCLDIFKEDFEYQSLRKTLVLRIENKAKTGIFGFVSIKSAYYSKPRRSQRNAPSTPVEKAQNYEFNGAFVA